jgi:hypothetical protein
LGINIFLIKTQSAYICIADLFRLKLIKIKSPLSVIFYAKFIQVFIASLYVNIVFIAAYALDQQAHPINTGGAGFKCYTFESAYNDDIQFKG